jgi:hypothetical protein
MSYYVTWGHMNTSRRGFSTFEAALYEYALHMRAFEKAHAAGSRSATSPSIYHADHDGGDGLTAEQREAVEAA